MPLAAILSATAPSSDRADLPRAHIIIAAQTLIEYQARQAIQAGARHLFVMVDAVTPVLSRLVDRLEGEGVHIHLVRDMSALLRQLPRDSDVLLFADGMIVDGKYVMQMAALTGNALLVADDQATTVHLERIDGVHRWAGLARVSPDTLFNTLDLIGDWDLVLTLLRAVVQNEAHRIVVAPNEMVDGRIALVDRQDAADLVGKSLAIIPDMGRAEVGAERYVLQPFAQRVATQLLRMQISVIHIVWSAIALALLGLLCIALGWTAASLLLFLIALAGDQVARRIGSIGHQGLPDTANLGLAAIVSVGFAMLGASHGIWSDGVHLGLLCMLTVAVVRQNLPLALPGWAFITPATALLLLLMGVLLGQFAVAMSLAALLGILSLGAMLLLGNPSNRNR